MDNPCYSVKEIFYSVQSEGPQSGRPAIFIRFAGCNLKCSFCDTKHDIVDGDKWIKEDDLLNRVRSLIAGHRINTKGILFVLTGGEPMMQVRNGRFLTSLYRDFPQAAVSIETNGTIDFTKHAIELMYSYPSMCLRPKVIVSPKEGQRVRLDRTRIDAVKLVVDTSDVSNLKKVQAKAHNFPGIPIYIQPMDVKGYDIEISHRLVIYKLLNRNPTWRLSVQYHKLIGVE